MNSIELPSPTATVSKILSSLTLEPAMQENKQQSPVTISCLKCDLVFEFPNKKDEYLAHLYMQHRLIIADVEEIANLENYLTYWEDDFKSHNVEEYCTTILLDQLPDGTSSKNEKYFLLSDILPRDYEIRKRLSSQRLEIVLAQHQIERTDREFSRECLHCRDVIIGLRADFLEHLFVKHFLQLGRPDNLVFIDELIDIVQKKLENLICLFCEKIFKSRATLKEHMRKKGHKRINPDIKLYDKYFLSNYKNQNFVSSGRTNLYKKQGRIPVAPRVETSTVKLDDDIVCNSLSDEDTNWSDWAGEIQLLTCLFCEEKRYNFHSLKRHMAKEHVIDFDQALETLNFYQKIKVVNYVRRQMHIKRCVTCNQIFDNLQLLQLHLNEAEHFGFGEKKQWDHPEYFFPTYEDDGLLYVLDNCKDSDSEEFPVDVFSEDSKADINRYAENLSLEKLND